MIDRTVIVGAGQAGFQVAWSLRDLKYAGEIHVIGDEPHLPYQRPPLSKAYLTSTGDARMVHFRKPEFFSAQSLTMHLGTRVVAIDRDRRCVAFSDGDRLAYSHLVLATGARARWLPIPGSELDGVVVLRGLDDAENLRRRLANQARIVVIGGGFIGLEFAAIANRLGCPTTIVEALERPLKRAVSRQLSSYLSSAHARRGVSLMVGRGVAAIHGNDHGEVAAVELDDGQRLNADIVLLAAGVLPNTELAAEAGLSTHGGISVGPTLQTSDRHISAIGDCASYPSAQVGRHIRLESVQNACDHGRFVAARIANGGSAPYVQVPWFWTHQYDVKVQMAGIGGPSDEVMTLGDSRTGAFSILRFTQQRLVCVESVNRPADHMAARRILASNHRPSPAEAQSLGFDLKTFAKVTPAGHR